MYVLTVSMRTVHMYLLCRGRLYICTYCVEEDCTYVRTYCIDEDCTYVLTVSMRTVHLSLMSFL